MLRVHAAIFLTFLVVLPGASAADVTNGGFENAVTRWKTRRASPREADSPVCSSAPLSPAAGKGLAGRRAVLGDAMAGPEPGGTPSFVFQDFECGTGGWCTLEFDAALWLVGGERAAVVLLAGDRVVVREIPGARGGRAGHYAVSVAGCRRARVVFAVWSLDRSDEGVRSVLHVDNVSSSCTTGDETSPRLLHVDLDSVPFAPDSLAGHLLRSADAAGDCDADGVPDNYALTQGMARDRNGDGRIDSCEDAHKKHTNWVLLGMGVLIIVVTVSRLLFQRRRSS